jgi:hypothetical protein
VAALVFFVVTLALAAFYAVALSRSPIGTWTLPGLVPLALGRPSGFVS